MTQEIIVYRNPGEKIFWDWATNSDVVGILSGLVLVGCAVALVVTVAYALWASVPPRFKPNRYPNVWRAKK